MLLEELEGFERKCVSDQSAKMTCVSGEDFGRGGLFVDAEASRTTTVHTAVINKSY